MASDYTPAASSASEHAYAGRIVTDPIPYTSYNSKRNDAKYGAQEWMSEILALIKASVSGMQYRKTYTCISGLAEGDPVYLSANNTATKALADTEPHSRVFGFVAYKPTTTTCYIQHFRQVTGLSGLTANAAVYLTNAGGYSASAGTINTPVGVALNTTDALLCATPGLRFLLSSIFSDAEGDPANVAGAAADGTSTFAARRDHVHTIGNDIVSNAMLANMAEATIQGRAVGAGTGDPTALTPTQAAAVTLSELVALGGIISPSAIGASQNDYNPTGLSTASTLRLSASSAYNITGIQGGSAGRILILHNVGSENITLKSEDGGSSAANRFILTADVELIDNSVVILQYDGTTQRWRLTGFFLPPATQADQEVATGAYSAVTPAVQHYHPSAAKGWVYFNGTGTPDDIIAYNCTSITDDATGTYTINWVTDFSATSKQCPTVSSNANVSKMVGVTAAGTSQVYCTNLSDVPVDPDYVMVHVFGDQ